ncbi:MAG: VCBS repeat-containing protein, partial [Planctomycetota bacterium]
MKWPRLNKRQALVFRWTGVSVGGVAVLTVAVAALARKEYHAVPSVGIGVEGVTSVLTKAVGRDEVPIRFENVSARMGISFLHFPAERASLLPEDMGSGVACGDYDADGFTDLFFVNISGSVLPGAVMDREQGKSRLYRNVNGELFEDVTDAAGVGFVGYGMGAAWGDYDNDGDLDLYVTSFGDNALYQNQGDGTFRDVTAQSGVQDSRFSSGCSWADYDRDGDLDLYVCNYVDFVFRESDRGLKVRSSAMDEPYTLNPSSYPAQPNSLFRNKGDGTFEEVAAAAGVANPTGKGLSASWVDMDNDGWVDLYVANDVSENGVFRNRGDGTFEDVGPSSLAADYRSAMGVAVADFDDDLDQDLVITHWIAQENALYQNMVTEDRAGGSTAGRLWFMDVADAFGLGQISLDMVGWATGFADFDNDGRRDLWMVNGNTLECVADHHALQPQQAFIFWNRGLRGYVEIAAKACPRLAKPFVGRGGAQVDFDRDGKVDLVWPTHGGEVIILKNISEPSGHWLRVDLRQRAGNRFALGARV